MGNAVKEVTTVARDLLTGLETREIAGLILLATISIVLLMAAVIATWRNRGLTHRLARAKGIAEAAEAKYARLLETVSDGVLVIPLDGGPIMLSNRRAAELTGYEAGELGNLRANKLFPPKGTENWLENAIVMGKGNFVGVDLQRKNGELALVDVEATSLRHAGRMAIQLTFRPSRSAPEPQRPRRRDGDVSAASAIGTDQVPPALLRMIEEAIERGRSALSLEIAAVVVSPTASTPPTLWLRRNAPAGLLQLNPPAAWLLALGEATDQQGGPVVWLAGSGGWSDALKTLAAQEVRMMTASPILVNGKRQGLLLLGSRTSHLMSPREWDALNQVSGEVSRAVELALQFMRLTDAVEELASAERLYRHLLESAPQVLLAVDAGGRLTFCNAAGRELFYLSANAAIGRSLDELTGGQGVVAHLLQEAMHENTAPARHRVRLTTRMGAPLEAEILIVPSVDAEGTTTGAAVALTPIRSSAEEVTW